MFIPYKVDVPMERQPVTNWILIALTVFISRFLVAVISSGQMPAEALDHFILGSGSIFAWAGHMLMHGGWLHLIGNMLFLWLFGNAICAKVGNIAFIPVYLSLGLIAAMVHMLADGTPAIGASGAINGIVGMFVIWYPLNDVSCFYFLFLHFRTFTVRSFWIILLWLFFDIFGAVSGTGSVAYFGHIGGFFGGAFLASLLSLSGMTEPGLYEQTLFQKLGLDLPLLDIKRLIRGHDPESASNAKHNVWTAPENAAPKALSGNTGVKGRIAFTCLCGKTLKVPQSAAGRTGRCRTCGRKIRVPGERHPDRY